MDRYEQRPRAGSGELLGGRRSRCTCGCSLGRKLLRGTIAARAAVAVCKRARELDGIGAVGGSFVVDGERMRFHPEAEL